MTVEEIQRKIKRQEDKLSKYDLKNMHTYTVHGGVSIGYIKGQIAIYELWLDSLKESRS